MCRRLAGPYVRVISVLKRKYFVNTVTLPEGDCEIPRGRLKTHIVSTLGAKQANSYIFQSRSEIL